MKVLYGFVCMICCMWWFCGRVVVVFWCVVMM